MYTLFIWTETEEKAYEFNTSDEVDHFIDSHRPTDFVCEHDSGKLYCISYRSGLFETTAKII
jgi:hypothetical protein